MEAGTDYCIIILQETENIKLFPSPFSLPWSITSHTLEGKTYSTHIDFLCDSYVILTSDSWRCSIKAKKEYTSMSGQRVLICICKMISLVYFDFDSFRRFPSYNHNVPFYRISDYDETSRVLFVITNEYNFILPSNISCHDV